MCGIYGVIHPRGEAEAVVAAMAPLIRHRGPDGAAVERLPWAILGHQRLSIIDLSPAGAQPMWDVSRRACIVYNGEIYNFRQLRAECEERGAVFRSQSDTEVILNLFLLDGPASFARLNGMFAFCLFDARSGVCHLARDPMGIKPLYYAQTPQGLFFASELKVLLASGAVPPEIDSRSMQAYLQLDFVPTPWSIVQSTQKLQAGHALRIAHTGSAELTRFVQLQPERAVAERSVPQNAEEFGRRLRNVVTRQMISDAPLGVLLSGGIDSSLVALTASEICDKPISTFSVAFTDRSFDESPYSNEVARLIRSHHHCETLRPERMLDLVPQIASVTSEPLADGSIFPTLLLSRFTRQVVKVALSGDGSDELFGGYPTYGLRRVSSLASRLPLPLRTAMNAAVHRLLPVSYDNFSLDFKVKKFLSGLHRDPVLRNMRWLGSFTAAECRDLLLSYSDVAQHEIEALYKYPSAGRSGLDALLRTDERFYMQDQVLVKMDRASMAASLEVRVPFLDHEMVTFAHGLPEKQRAFKRILRHYAASRLPSTIVRRRKKGFGVPLGRWFRGPLKSMLGDLLSPSRVGSLGIFNARIVTRLCDEHWRGSHDHRKKLFNILMFVLWHDEYAAVQHQDASCANVTAGQ